MDEAKQHRTASKTKKIVLWAAGLVLLWTLLTGAFILLLKPDQSKEFRQQLNSLSSDFPLYYPDKLPRGVTLSPKSVKGTSAFVSYGLMKGDNRITVTQQARPKLMEEVNKTQDVSSPLGKAYVAQLEKRNVGFLQTDMTLLTITSTENLDDSTLVLLLQSLVSL